ncbi:hypothetical protein [Pseudanabaena sp. lw0831]|uniref:hypothetical protein n=1 Tax=Pseudanabaena sp. lw0831 TaxID=1357935 RepID=UPI0019167411|nr:hypothetical protein [Pseudanabaena sp. lw0831]
MNNQIKVVVFSQVKAIVDHVCNKESLEELSTSSEKENNTDLATSISEVFKIYMRQIARNAEQYISDSIVEQASHQTIKTFSNNLKKHSNINHNKVLEKIRFYVKKTQESLTKKPSKTQKSTVSSLIEATNDFRFNRRHNDYRDIQSEDEKYIGVFNELKGYLSNCKNQVNAPERNIPNLYISKVGFDDFIEGLFIYPSIEDSDEFLIDFTNLPSQFRLRDSSNLNFPFEFIKEEFVFIQPIERLSSTVTILSKPIFEEILF